MKGGEESGFCKASNETEKRQFRMTGLLSCSACSMVSPRIHEASTAGFPPRPQDNSIESEMIPTVDGRNPAPVDR